MEKLQESFIIPAIFMSILSLFPVLIIVLAGLIWFVLSLLYSRYTEKEETPPTVYDIAEVVVTKLDLDPLNPVKGKNP